MKNLYLAVFAICILVATDANAGTRCNCRYHSAEAEADGTCSRTEDSSYCTLAFSATPLAYRDVFVKSLVDVTNIVSQRIEQEIPISTNVDETLGFAFETPPEAWGPENLKKHLPLLFAMSQRDIFKEGRSAREGLNADNYYFREATIEVTAFIFENADQIAKQWSNKESLAGGAKFEQVGNHEAIISYGCIEVHIGTAIYTMVKTKFSLGGFSCSDTDPELYVILP